MVILRFTQVRPAGLQCNALRQAALRQRPHHVAVVREIYGVWGVVFFSIIAFTCFCRVCTTCMPPFVPLHGVVCSCSYCR
jgi:hypothetical protein